MKCKRFFSVLAAAAMLALTLSACGGSKDDELDKANYKSALTREELEQEVDFDSAEEEGEIYTFEDGMVTIQMAAMASSARISDYGELWANDGQYPGFTMPESVMMSDGSLGILKIPAIGLELGVWETEDELEAMRLGVGHLRSTSCFDGNVGLTAHNAGENRNFGRLHELKAGDQVILETALGTRTYSVQASKTIDEYDWSMLGRTETNMVTLITCITGQPSNRLCVQAVEITN